MGIQIEDFSQDNAAGFAACQAIRHAVFCVEQQVPEDMEWDGLDGDCRHFLLRVDGAPAAAARSRPYGPGEIKIERVAVLAAHRGSGLGRLLMEHVLAHAQANGARAAVLNAQTAVREFYAGLGFTADSPEFTEAGIPHIHMTLRLA